MKQYKRHRDYGFFDQDIRLEKLSKLGDPLEKLNKYHQVLHKFNQLILVHTN